MTTLYVRDDSGYHEAGPQDVLTRARALLSQRYRAGTPVLSTPDRTREFLRLHLGPLEYEVFGVLHLDVRMRLIGIEDLFRGTLDGASVHPREVVKAALAKGSAALVLYHNHPSGAAEPSTADELVTQRLREALALVEIRVADHLIVGERIYSFAESGRL